MKKLFTVAFVVFFFFALSECGSNKQLLEAKTPILKAENVIPMQVVGGLASTKPSPLYKNNDAIGRAMITKAVVWINSSFPIGEQPYYGKHGYPRVLKMQLSVGDPLYVQVGYKCVTTKSHPPGIFVPEGQIGSFKSCSEVKDEIVVSNTKINLRAKSPQLYEWLKKWEKTESKN